MPIKELTTSEQIKILKDLDTQERLYDKNLSLVKGDVYTLRHKLNMDVEPEPFSMIQETFRQKPTIKAIQNVTAELQRGMKKPRVPEIRPVIKTIPKDEPIIPDPLPEVKQPEVKESEEDLVLKKHGFPTYDEIDGSKLEIADIIVKVSSYNKNVLGAQLAQLTKKGMKDGTLYQSIQHEIQLLKDYKKNLLDRFENQKVLIERTGLGLPRVYMKIGRYYANKEDISQGKLKIRKKNKAKVNGIADMFINEGVKHLLLKRYDPRMDYSKEDIAQFRKICELTGLRPKKYSKLWGVLHESGMSDRIYVTNVVDAQKRLINALGEVKAGNNNLEVKNEIVSLADFLLKNRKIGEGEYKNLMSLINE